MFEIIKVLNSDIFIMSSSFPSEDFDKKNKISGIF